MYKGVVSGEEIGGLFDFFEVQYALLGDFGEDFMRVSTVEVVF